MRRRLALALLAGLAGCGGPDRIPTCGPAEALVENASALAIEQFYLARAGAAGWGANLLGQRHLPSGATMPIRFAGTGSYSLRMVWVDGRAVEMPAVDGCTVRRITVLDDELRAG
jgi:hypothetical protein